MRRQNHCSNFHKRRVLYPVPYFEPENLHSNFKFDRIDITQKLKIFTGVRFVDHFLHFQRRRLLRLERHLLIHFLHFQKRQEIRLFEIPFSVVWNWKFPDWIPSRDSIFSTHRWIIRRETFSSTEQEIKEFPNCEINVQCFTSQFIEQWIEHLILNYIVGHSQPRMLSCAFSHTLKSIDLQKTPFHSLIVNFICFLKSSRW